MFWLWLKSSPICYFISTYSNYFIQFINSLLQAVYVESDYNHVMDIDDLEKKLVEYPNCKFCLISHMRGKLADMDKVKDALDRHGVTLLEDCAHSLGVEWKGKHSGHVGKVAAISAQSYKMINSGEGGFLLTDDAEIAAKCAAGSSASVVEACARPACFSHAYFCSLRSMFDIRASTKVDVWRSVQTLLPRLHLPRSLRDGAGIKRQMHQSQPATLAEPLKLCRARL